LATQIPTNLPFEEILTRLNTEGPELADRTLSGKVFKSCFMGSQLLDCLAVIIPRLRRYRPALLHCGNQLLQLGAFSSLMEKPELVDSPTAYYVYKDDVMAQSPSLEELQALVALMKERNTPAVMDRKSYYAAFSACFVGREMVDTLVKVIPRLHGYRPAAITFGQRMIDVGLIYNCHGEKMFTDDAGSNVYAYRRPNILQKSQLEQIAKALQKVPIGPVIQDRIFLFKTYKDCFVGSELVDSLLLLLPSLRGNRREATLIGQELLNLGFLSSVIGKLHLLDGYHWYHW